MADRKGNSLMKIVLVSFIGVVIISFIVQMTAFEPALQGREQFKQSYPEWISQSDTIENLSVTNYGSLRLDNNTDTGLFVSSTFSTQNLSYIDFDTAEAETDLSGGNIYLEVIVSDTLNFQNNQSVRTSLAQGDNVINLDQLNNSIYGKVRLEYER